MDDLDPDLVFRRMLRQLGSALAVGAIACAIIVATGIPSWWAFAVGGLLAVFVVVQALLVTGPAGDRAFRDIGR